MEITINKIELGTEVQPTVIEMSVDINGGIQGVETVTSSDNHIQVNDTDIKNPVLSWTTVDGENFVTDAEKAVVQNTSGVNTGDQDLSGYSLTSHNHALANLTERSYDSLTDKPNLDAYIDIINVQFWSEDAPIEFVLEGDIWYDLANKLLYVWMFGWVTIPFDWKFYLDRDENSDFFGKYFVYNGTELSIIPDGLVLGETASTAFDGLRGKAAYDHSLATGNPHGTAIGELTNVDLTETTPLATDSVLIEQTTTGKVKKSLLSTIVTFLSSTFATKTELGDINTILDDINGEVI